jgi:hypothetical protein
MLPRHGKDLTKLLAALGRPVTYKVGAHATATHCGYSVCVGSDASRHDTFDVLSRYLSYERRW